MQTTTERVREQIELQAASITEAHQHFELDEHESHECDEYPGEDFFDWLNNSGGLSVEVTWTGSLGTRPDIDQIRYVLCTGGPHVELRYDGTRATYHGWDWFGEGDQTMAGDDAAIYVGEFWFESARDFGMGGC